MTQTCGVIVSLYDGLVFAQELEVYLVLGLVPLEGGEVEVEVEATGVAAGALDVGAECSILEPGGGPPTSAAAVVVR